MMPCRSLIFLTTLVSLLFFVSSAAALPKDNDRNEVRHVTRTITVTATQICSTPKSFGTTSSYSSTPTSCPLNVAQITKTVTASSTVTVTSRQTTPNSAYALATITVTTTDTVTNVLSGSKIISPTSAPSTITVTKTVTSNANASASPGTVTITVSKSGPTTTITTTASAAISTATITIPPSSFTETVIATTTLTTTPSASCTNPVINGGFESGTLDWTVSNANPGLTFTTQSSSSIPGGAHSGSSAGAFVTNGGPFLPGIPVDIYQTITGVDPSCASTGKYQISLFAKTVANSCFINIFNDINANSPVLSVQIQPGGSQPAWEEILTVVSMPLQNGFTLTVDVACNTQDTVWIDDVTIMTV